MTPPPPISPHSPNSENSPNSHHLPSWRVIAPWALVALSLFWALRALQTTLSPLFAALVLAYLMAGPVDRLQGVGVPRALASLLVMLGTITLLTAAALIFLPIIQTEVELLRQQLPDLVAKVSDSILPWFERVTGVKLRLDPQAIRTWITRQWSEGGGDLAVGIMDYARSGGSAVLEIVSVVLLVPIVLFYLLVDWHDLRRRTLDLIPPRWMGGVVDALDELHSMISGWLQGVLLLTIVLAVFYAAGLWIAGFQLWWALGLLTGILMFVPYLGFALALLLALLAGMLQFGVGEGIWRVAIVYSLGQAIESWWLTPKLVGERVGLHPVVVILALLVFGNLLGFVGVLLALPLAAVTIVLLRRLHRAWLRSPIFEGNHGPRA